MAGEEKFQKIHIEHLGGLNEDIIFLAPNKARWNQKYCIKDRKFLKV